LRIDRFHVQKIALDALQKIRIKYRRQALDNVNDAIEYVRNKSSKESSKLLQNGDMLKQLLAKSRYFSINQGLNGLKISLKDQESFFKKS
jgi:transposase